MRSTTVLLAICLALLVALAAGCGGDDDGDTEESTPPAETAGGDTGDPGAAVFASAGCGGCHTLAAANASGAVGPNLDELQPDLDTVVEQVTNGGGGMPAFADQLSEQQIQDVAAFVSENAGS